MSRGRLIFCGIDLAGSENRISGVAFLDNKLNVRTYSLYSNKEILDSVRENKPLIISIDAPLSLPKENSENKHFRKCDLELKKMRIRFFPIDFGPMKMLTKRGIYIKETLSKEGYAVLETFPGAFYDLYKIERKNFKKILEFFKRILNFCNETRNLHEMDAITCAYISYLYYNGKAKEIGDKEEGTIVIPKV